MADSNQETSIIAHLLKVEKNASYLIDDAVKEAEDIISKARVQSNQIFKEKYEECVSLLEKEYKEKVESLQQEHNQSIQEYKDTLTSKEQNKKSFNSLLNQLLFADAE